MRWWLGLAVGIVLTACGDAGASLGATTTVAYGPGAATTTVADASAGATATMPPATATTTSPQVAPLETYAFAMTVMIAPEQGQPTIAAQLAGVGRTTPYAVHVHGDLFDSRVDLLTDGSQWWDLDEPDLPLTAEDVAFFLGANGFLRPEDIDVPLADPNAWRDLGAESHLGVPVSHRQRSGIVKDRDWSYGDLITLDVWQDDAGNLVKLVARWATGDNLGFPVSIWEITDRNPDVEPPAPPSS